MSRGYYEAAFAAGRLRLEGGGRARRVLSTTPLMVPASGECPWDLNYVAVSVPHLWPPCYSSRRQAAPPCLQCALRDAHDMGAQAGDRVRHFLHRHEPPVLDIEIQVRRQLSQLANSFSKVALCKRLLTH